MGTYPRNEYDGGRLERCATCDAIVTGWGEGNTVCALCGMRLNEQPFEDSDYLDMIMRVRHRLGRAARRQPHSSIPEAVAGSRQARREASWSRQVARCAFCEGRACLA